MKIAYSHMPQAKYAWMIELKHLTAKERKKVGSVVKDAETQLAQYLADPQLVPMVAKGLELRRYSWGIKTWNGGR